MVSRMEGGWGLGEEREGIKKYRSAFTEWSQGCDAQHRECGQ